jgi:hypothetical protein
MENEGGKRELPAFKIVEKKYKKYKATKTDFSDVLDFWNWDECKSKWKTHVKKCELEEEKKFECFSIDGKDGTLRSAKIYTS